MISWKPASRTNQPIYYCVNINTHDISSVWCFCADSIAISSWYVTWLFEHICSKETIPQRSFVQTDTVNSHTFQQLLIIPISIWNINQWIIVQLFFKEFPIFGKKSAPQSSQMFIMSCLCCLWWFSWVLLYISNFTTWEIILNICFHGHCNALIEIRRERSSQQRMSQGGTHRKIRTHFSGYITRQHSEIQQLEINLNQVNNDRKYVASFPPPHHANVCPGGPMRKPDAQRSLLSV